MHKLHKIWSITGGSVEWMWLRRNGRIRYMLVTWKSTRRNIRAIYSGSCAYSSLLLWRPNSNIFINMIKKIKKTSEMKNIRGVCVSTSTITGAQMSKLFLPDLIHIMMPTQLSFAPAWKTSLQLTELWWNKNSLLESASSQTPKTAPEQPKESFPFIHVRLWISHCLSHNAWLEGCMLHQNE